MSRDIIIKKGLDLKLAGEAERLIANVNRSETYSLKPDDFHGVTPKLIAKVGAKVKAGSPVFYSKVQPSVLFPSPVSGEIVEIVRGAKRKILEIKIKADAQDTYEDFGSKNPAKMNSQEIIDFLLKGGCWPFIQQRPYAVVANPESKPRDIYISAYNSEPLAADLDFVLESKQENVKLALEALCKLTEGKVHVGLHKESTSKIFKEVKGLEIHNLSGVHPVGNVGTQINKTNPINKGEVIWTVAAQDLATIGELFTTGKFNAEKLIAVTGAQVSNPNYVRAIAGAEMKDVLNGKIVGDNNRVINGSVFTGTTSSLEGNLGFYNNQISVIEQGDDYDFLGWNIPRPNKFSTLRANMFSFLTPNKKYSLNTNTNGEHRAMVLTGHYEKVFPMDIYPMQLVKACLYKDIDEMEALGIYEVAPEDFALAEFVCPSKTNHQAIIRAALDLMIKEVG